MFRRFNKKNPPRHKGFSYDKSKLTPVIHASICNGEQVAGFKNKETGEFEEVMFIGNPRDLEQFRQLYGIESEDIRKEY